MKPSPTRSTTLILSGASDLFKKKNPSWKNPFCRQLYPDHYDECWFRHRKSYKFTGHNLPSSLKGGIFLGGLRAFGIEKKKSVYIAHRFLRIQFESGVATWSRTVGCTEPVGYDEIDSIGFHT